MEKVGYRHEGPNQRHAQITIRASGQNRGIAGRFISHARKIGRRHIVGDRMHVC